MLEAAGGQRGVVGVELDADRVAAVFAGDVGDGAAAHERVEHRAGDGFVCYTCLMSKVAKQTQTITIRVSPLLRENIRAYADAREMSPSDFVRYAIRFYMDSVAVDDT